MRSGADMPVCKIISCRWNALADSVWHLWQVRVVCKANGVFIRQAGGHYEYEGGDTRLVSVSNWVSLTALKEAMERVVAKAPSRSVSGPPEVSHPQCLITTPSGLDSAIAVELRSRVFKV